MSYILDALRKADAQREADPARGIHAQATPAALAGSADKPRGERWLWGGIAAVALLAAGWVGFGTADRARRPVASPIAIRDAPPAVAPATVVLASPAPIAIAIAPAAPAARVAAATPAEMRRPPPAPAPAPAPATAAAVVERSHSLAELPADVQQAMPKLAISGGVYSENVAQRMLVVNGQVFNEGSEIAPGVVLEQIRPRVAQLRFRGLRVAHPY